MSERYPILKMGLTSFIPIVAFFFAVRCDAQELPNQILPSPTTMQFQKYGDYPVSHYTGIPDIKIPIYTIKTGDITVPIYLSFHASGLSVDELNQPAFIGPGWTLHTGGLMSRTIYGLPDEYGTSVPDFSTNYRTKFYEMKDQYDNKDSELDVYSYNVLGHSGKFIPSANYQLDPYGVNPYDPFKLKENNLKIEIGQIVDENGIKYVFGGDGGEEYQSFNLPNNAVVQSAVTTWHLSYIGSAKFPGMGVGYSYQAGQAEGNVPVRKYILDDAYETIGNSHDSAYDIGYFFPYSIPLNNNTVTLPEVRQYHSVLPHEIFFPTGRIRVVLDAAKALKQILIYDKDNVVLRKVDFVADRFGGSGPYRRLKAVVFKDASDTEYERYSFNYYGEFSNIGGNLSKDYWGFYNGYPYAGDHIQRFTGVDLYYRGGYYNDGARSATLGGSANRTPNSSASVCYMLDKITYPTGGYTLFSYEANRSKTAELGGLRVKEISSHQRNGELVSKKSYSYTPGALEMPIEQRLFMEHQVIWAGVDWGRRRTFSESSPIPLMPKGAPIGYESVVETEGETTTSYKFDNQAAYQYDDINFPLNWLPRFESDNVHRMFAHHYKPWNFGDLLVKTVSAPGLFSVETYDYESFVKSTVHDLVMKKQIESVPGLAGTPSDWLLHTEMYESMYNFAKRYHYSGIKRLVSKSYWKGDAFMGTGVGTGEWYNYANLERPMHVTSKTTVNSWGDHIRTDLTYPFDYTGPVFDALVQENRVGEPIEQVTKNVIQDNKQISREKVEYDFFNPVAGPWGGPGSAQLKHILKAVGENNLEIEASVEKYDDMGHILQQRGRDGLTVSFIYGYQDNYPVAKIVGADYATAILLVNHTFLNHAGVETEQDVRAHLSALRSGLPGAMVSTYTYKIGVGMTSETDARGQTMFYEYDSFQRLITTRDHNGKILKSNEYNLKNQ